jgi:hypothetical protein
MLVHPLSFKFSKVFNKSLKETVSSCLIRNIYHCKFQSPLRYGVIFAGADNASIPIFEIQNTVNQTMCGVGTGISCRQLCNE